MTTILRGRIKNGRVELEDPSAAIEGAEVTVMQPGHSLESDEHKPITFGMFRNWGVFDEEDFKAAEWHGDPDDGLDWTGA